MTFGTHFWNIPPATQSCDQSSATPPPNLVSITVTPVNTTLALGLTLQYHATGNYSDGTSKDITSQVAWNAKCGIYLCSSTPPASISASGLATAQATGSIDIYASSGSITGSTLLYVGSATLQSITVTPSNPTINQYTTQQFTATGYYSDGTSKPFPSPVWSSGTTSVATIDVTGVATALTAGTSTITATVGTLSGSTTLNVSPVTLQSISVTPVNPSFAKGLTQQMAATGTYSDATVRDVTSQVSWSSDTPSVATVGSGGLVLGTGLGTANVNASLSGITGGTTVNVTAAVLQSIAIAPASPVVENGLTIQLAAIGTYSDNSTQDISANVTWTSGSTSVATVDGTGLATGVSLGSSLVGASLNSISGSTTLNVIALGSSWATVTNGSGGGSGTTNTLYGVVWTGTEFVTVGASGTIMTSADGTTWTGQSSGTGANLYAVAWTGTQLVAVGAGGVILTSPNGVTWTPRSSGYSFDLNAVIWTGTQIVAVGNSATSLTSTDGIAWAAVSPAVPPYQQAFGIGWNGSIYLVGTNTVSNYVNYPEAYVSTDLSAWSYVSAVSGFFSYGICWSGSQFVLVQSGGRIFTTSDGATWYSHASGTSANLRAVDCSAAQYVVVGDSGTVLTSPDASTWSSRTSGTSAILRSVAWSGKHFVAVGDSGTIIYTSP